MPATIRLRRVGRKKQAAFRIVVANKSDAATGKYIESLGVYNPRTQPSVVRMDGARALHWLRDGAKPSDTVRSILQEVGLWERFHEGAAPEDLAPEEAQILRGPKPGEAKTSRRGAQEEAAAEAAEEAEVEAEPRPEPEPEAEAEEEEPEAEAEEEPEAEADEEAGADEEEETDEEDEQPEAEAEEAAEEDEGEEEDEEPEASEEDEPEASADEDEEEEDEEEKEG